MTSLEKGAKAAISQCLSVTPEDKVIIVTDQETLEIGKTLEKYSKKVTEDVLLLIIENFTARPAKELPQELVDLVNKFEPTVSIYAAAGKEGELPVFRRPLIDGLFFKRHGCRHAHMINITKPLMEDGMNKDYDLVYKATHKVYDIVKPAQQIKVTCPYGTSILFNLDPKKLEWQPSDGRITTERWQNLPSGETFNCPKSADGVFVAWVLGDNLSEKYGVLNTPMEVTIKEGYITKVQAQDPTDSKTANAVKDFEKYIKQYEFSNRIGELGIGTLVGLKHFVGNLLQDEKYPGVHIAFGHPYPNETGADWDAPSHIDIIAKNTSIVVVTNGIEKEIMKRGKYIEEILLKD